MNWKAYFLFKKKNDSKLMVLQPYFKLILILLLVSISSQMHGIGRKPTEYKIQIALLIDVSGSMDVLLNQAKGQIWNLVNTLSDAQKKGGTVRLEFALATFGHGDFANNGYFKLRSKLSTDIDSISQLLNELETGGSEEYCGFAIQQVLDCLLWSKGNKDLRIICIAGNESFGSGAIDYLEACKNARKKGVIVNTIFCGGYTEGRQQLWEDGALRGRGKYLSISLDSNVKKTETLWDDKIIYFNNRLNSTLIPYGLEGERLMKRHLALEGNALVLGNAYFRDRITYKLRENTSNAYWDLLDAFALDSSILEKLLPESLPVRMVQMNKEDIKKHLQQKQLERMLYKQGVLVYLEKAKEFSFKFINSANPSLDFSIISTVKEQAMARDFTF